jgi:16S rRNA (cytidine1402-2'-O)-methyltransferase
MKMLNHFEIKKPLVSYYEHNRASSGARILERLLAGESCALVTDAGMPAISDPGEDIVRQCAEAGVPVSAAPGPSAVVTALAVSGLPTGRFTFEGFLSVTKKSRFEHLDSLRGEKRTMVFYEAPHKLERTLRDMLETFGDRRIALCRELTKLHEEVVRTTLSEALRRCESDPPRGEYVLVLAGAPDEPPVQLTAEEALAVVEEYRATGHSLREACRLAAEETGYTKNELYTLAVRQ